MTGRIGRIVGGLGMIVFVAAVVVSATGAFFSDTETSTGNTFAAGDIDLQIDNESYIQATSTQGSGPSNMIAWPATSWAINNLTNQLFFSFTDVKPGDLGEDTISVHAGSNDAFACMAGDITATPENTLVDPESDAGDVGPALGDNGELQNFINFSFWNDDGDNVFEVGETQITALTGPASQIFNGAWSAIVGTGTPIIAGNSTRYVAKSWCFGTLTPAAVAQDGAGKLPGSTNGPLVRGTGFSCDGSGNNNIAQTDGIVVDVSFYAVQVRNNGQFTCASLPTFVGSSTARTLVGAALAAYVAPAVETCAETVTGTESIQAAIDAVTTTAGETVCVDPTYDRTGDNVAIQVNKDITLAATVRGVDLDVPVALASDGATVTGFDCVIGTAATIAEQAAFYVLGATDNFEISFNTVTGGVGAGVLTETGGTNNGGLIANNVLNGSTQGIYTNPHSGTITIEENDILNNVAGIGGLMGAIVRNNEFNHTVAGSEAIGVDGLADTNPATVSLNNFLNGIRLNDYGAAVDVIAENNFWNTGGVNQTTAGEVDFTPETLVQYAHN